MTFEVVHLLCTLCVTNVTWLEWLLLHASGGDQHKSCNRNLTTTMTTTTTTSMLYLFIYLWLYLYPVCHEYKVWSQVLMKEEILKAINGVCWLLLNTLHATYELCCLKINFFKMDSGFIWCSTSWVIEACYDICWFTAMEIGTFGCVKSNSHSFSCTECNMERISIITREYQWWRLYEP